MTTSQTIDGVPRRICHACVTLARNAYCPVCDDARAAQIRGEPVAYQFQDREGKWWGFTSERHYQSTKDDGSWPIRALFTEQPAPVAVVMPARIASDHLNEMAQGWNSCIDAVNRLNDINQ